jgi:polysaccharide biosynthesis/export protein
MTTSLSGALIGLLSAVLATSALQAQQPALAPSGADGIVAGTTSMEVLDTTRTLGAGDRLSYRVVEERRVPLALIVADSGEVEVPLIGRVPARGRTCKQLAMAIKPLLERDYFFKATVIIGLDAISAKARGRVYISGQVRQQGAVDLPADERFTISKAILKAGGFADFANKRKIKLLRKSPDGSTETLFIDLDAVTVRGELNKDLELQPDDTIIVPEKFINF